MGAWLCQREYSGTLPGCGYLYLCNDDDTVENIHVFVCVPFNNADDWSPGEKVSTRLCIDVVLYCTQSACVETTPDGEAVV